MDTRTLLRVALHPFRRQPLYAFACAGTLALAVAAATASFAVVGRAFLDPLPYPAGERLLSLYTNTETWPQAPVSAHVMAELAAQGGPLTGFTGIDPDGVSFTRGGATEEVDGLLVDPEFFRTIGAPEQGRGWVQGERDVAVVSWAFWRESLGGDPGVVGSTITLDGVAHTVVGVMPRGFAPPYWPDRDVLRPLDHSELLATRPRDALDLTVLARRVEGATPRQVEEHLAAFSASLQQRYPDVHGRERWEAFSLRTELVGSARPVLAAAGAAALLLLLVVGANIGGLSAALAIGESRRVAVQSALGATRRRLLAERALQGLALGAIGSAAGVWLAAWLVDLAAAFQPHFLSRLSVVELRGDTAALGLAVGIVTAVVASALPHAAMIAWRLESPSGARGATASPALTAARSALIVFQVALTLVLLVGAGLLVRTMRTLSETSLGFRTEGLQTVRVTLSGARYEGDEARIQFEQELLERLRAIPGVTDATASGGIPVIGGSRAGLIIQGRDDESGRGEVAYFSAAPGFFDTWSIRLLAGRDFGAGDRLAGPGAIVVNESMARKYWPAGDALGARIWIGPNGPGEGESWMTVVGVVGDVRQHGPAEEVLPTAFGSTRQFPWPRQWFTVRADGAVREAVLRAAVSAVDPAVPVGLVRRADELVADAVAPQRLVLLSVGVFGGVAAALCGFGMFAVLSLTARLRRREYAIRLAVGARPRGVRWLVIRQGLVLGATGVALGLLLAAGSTRALEGLLHGVSPLDPTAFGAAAAGALVIALLGAWSPARQVGRLDAAEVLAGG